MKHQKLALILLPFLIISFLSVIPFSLSQDTSAINLTGVGWSLKVDSSLNTELASKNPITVSTQKAGTEKTIYLQLQDLEDCKTGYIQFKVQTTGLTIYKQLPLNEEIQLKEGEIDFVNATHAMLGKTVKVYRPIEVVNSFACYDEAGKKVLHIYASNLKDATNNIVWCNSDLKDGLLTVYLNNEFLVNAKFPIVLDPTFGYTSIGGSHDDFYGYSEASKFTLTEAGNIESISVYVSGADGKTLSVALYSISGGVPNTRLATASQSITGNDGQWVTANFSSAYSATATDYGLGFYINGGAQYYFDSGSNAFYGTGGCPDPWSVGGNWSQINSVYATYTTEEEPTPTPTPTATPTPTPTATPEPTTTPTEFTSTETWNIIILLVMLIVGLILALKRTLPILNFVFGMFAIAISAWTLTIAPYFGGLLQLAVIIIGIIVMVSGYKEVY